MNGRSPSARSSTASSRLRGRRTVVLATGDPLNYGVARKLLEVVPFAEMEIVPHLSSFSLAAARMGWPLRDCDTMTLHGRPAARSRSLHPARCAAPGADRRWLDDRRGRAPARRARLWRERAHRAREHGRSAREQLSFRAEDFAGQAILRSQHARHLVQAQIRRGPAAARSGPSR